MSEYLAMFIPGRPAPQGSKVSWTMPNGAHVMTEQSKYVGPWRTAVKHAVKARTNLLLADLVPFTVPVIVRMDFYLTKGKTVTRPYPTSKNDGDVDKFARATNDALVLAGVLADDGLIVDLRTRKQWATEAWPAGAWIRIKPAGTLLTDIYPQKNER